MTSTQYHSGHKPTTFFLPKYLVERRIYSTFTITKKDNNLTCFHFKSFQKWKTFENRKRKKFPKNGIKEVYHHQA